MTYKEIEKKTLDGMTCDVEYRASDIGEIVFGTWKHQIGDVKFPYTRQALALMIGKHLKKMRDEKVLYHSLSSNKSVWIKWK